MANEDKQIKQMIVSTKPIISRSMDDFLTPGVIIKLTIAEAAALGAFKETALDEAAAWQSNLLLTQ